MFGLGRPQDPREAIHREHQKLYRSNTVHGSRPSEVIRSEAIPFLLLSGGKAIEVLAEYLTWRDTSDESRLGYLRAMLAAALQTRRRWPSSVLMTSSGAELRERARQHLQAEAALAL